MDIRDKINICTVVARAILVDDKVTDAEHRFVSDLIKRYGLDQKQRMEVLAHRVEGDGSEAAGRITDPEARKDLLRELVSVVALDGEIAPQERQLVARVAKAVGASEKEADALIAEAIISSKR